MPWCVFLGWIAQLVKAWLRVPFSTVSVVVLYGEKNIPQVTVSSLTPGSYLANLFIHLFIQSSHSLSHPNSYTLTKNWTRQRLQWCCEDESGMDHTQAVGSPVNCHWSQMVPIAGCDGQADRVTTVDSKEGVTRDFWTLRGTKIYITIL